MATYSDFTQLNSLADIASASGYGNKKIIGVVDSGAIKFYEVGPTDLGSGITMADGKFANPVGGDSSVSFADITGQPSDNSALESDLNSKKSLTTKTTANTGELPNWAAWIADTSASALTRPMPTSPSDGEEVTIRDGGNNAEVNNITPTVTAPTTIPDGVLNVNGQSKKFRYDSTGDTWDLVFSDAPASSGGGSEQSLVNSFLPLNFGGQDLYQSADGSEWLKTGVIETDNTNYPDAYVTEATPIYSGESFSFASGSATYEGMTDDGTNFYVLSSSTGRVYVHNSDGTYTGTSFLISGTVGQPIGIAFANGFLWIIGNASDTAYKFNTSGVYQNESWSFASETGAPRDITFDGTHFWIVSDGPDEVFKYDTSGVYTGFSFAVTQDLTPRGIAYDGQYLWVHGQSNDTNYKFDINGNYLNVSFSSFAQDSSVNALSFSFGKLWIVGNTTTDAYGYVLSYIGSDTAKTDPSSQLSVYTCIKKGTDRFPINSVTALNVGSVDVYDGTDGFIYLKSGVIETDGSKYPDAYNPGSGVGMPTARTDSISGFPIYMRVK